MIGILHNIRSVHNVGSMFRTADVAGIEKLYLVGTTPTPLDQFDRLRNDFAKVSLGAETSVEWEYAKTLAPLLARLHNKNFYLIGIEQDAHAQAYAQWKTRVQQARLAFVVGNEVRGLSRAMLGRCDTILTIPMHGTKESLNVSVAFGVIAFHLRDCLHAKR
jgi:23S rRNA (guanosine2251-2'-O)-methyltransferase